MTDTTSNWYDRVRRFLGSDLWSLELRPGSIAASALRTLQLFVMVGEGFVRDHLLLRAAALTYMTCLSVVPLFAVSFSILNALGVSENLVELAVSTLAAGSPSAQTYILDLVRHANIAGLGTLGAGILLITTVLALRQIEETLNQIWGIRHSRSWMRRFTDYLAIVVIAPLFFAMALSLANTVESDPLVQGLLKYSVFGTLYNFALQQMPKLVLAIGFAFLYWFFPNTEVRIRAALFGGIVSALLFSAAQDFYVSFNLGAARASALFGGLSALPLFLAWNYVSWAIVLFGSELSFAMQNLARYRTEIQGEALGPADRETVGLQLAVEIARGFRDCAPPVSSEKLAEELGLSVRLTREILELLEGARVVSVITRGNREEGYQLARPADRIAVGEVLETIRGRRESLTQLKELSTSSVVNHFFSDLDSANDAIANRITLLELLGPVQEVAETDSASESAARATRASAGQLPTS